MRALVLALLLVGPASAQAPQPEADRITFTRAELQKLQDELEGMVREREAAAYRAGQADIRQRCASLI